MIRKIAEPAAPTGLKLKLFRAPIYLYRMKLGFLLGRRFILLKHWGRKSATLKEAVIEVIHRNEAEGKIYSASGFGEKSQWFKNIQANNQVWLTTGNTEFQARARILSSEDAEVILQQYVRQHPNSIKGVARLSGYVIDGDDADISAFSKIIRIIEFSIVS